MRLTENLYDLLKKSRKLQIYCCKRSRCCLEDDLPIYINWVTERHIISISDWRHLPWANFINIHNISAKQKSIFFCLKIRSKYKNQLENSILYYSFRTKNIRAHQWTNSITLLQSHKENVHCTRLIPADKWQPIIKLLNILTYYLNKSKNQLSRTFNL